MAGHSPVSESSQNSTRFKSLDLSSTKSQGIKDQNLNSERNHYSHSFGNSPYKVHSSQAIENGFANGMELNYASLNEPAPCQNMPSSLHHSSSEPVISSRLSPNNLSVQPTLSTVSPSYDKIFQQQQVQMLQEYAATMVLYYPHLFAGLLNHPNMLPNDSGMQPPTSHTSNNSLSNRPQFSQHSQIPHRPPSPAQSPFASRDTATPNSIGDVSRGGPTPFTITSLAGVSSNSPSTSNTGVRDSAGLHSIHERNQLHRQATSGPAPIASSSRSTSHPVSSLSSDDLQNFMAMAMASMAMLGSADPRHNSLLAPEALQALQNGFADPSAANSFLASLVSYSQCQQQQQQQQQFQYQQHYQQQQLAAAHRQEEQATMLAMMAAQLQLLQHMSSLASGGHYTQLQQLQNQLSLLSCTPGFEAIFDLNNRYQQQQQIPQTSHHHTHPNQQKSHNSYNSHDQGFKGPYGSGSIALSSPSRSNASPSTGSRTMVNSGKTTLCGQNHVTGVSEGRNSGISPCESVNTASGSRSGGLEDWRSDGSTGSRRSQHSSPPPLLPPPLSRPPRASHTNNRPPSQAGPQVGSSNEADNIALTNDIFSSPANRFSANGVLNNALTATPGQSCCLTSPTDTITTISVPKMNTIFPSSDSSGSLRDMITSQAPPLVVSASECVKPTSFGSFMEPNTPASGTSLGVSNSLASMMGQLAGTGTLSQGELATTLNFL
ncbi:unnamed protein product [Protopolystoma xenopodis]|uniref:Uncharacterized protein n=1 Tax=Protopolystoma xenopodis TaxID=117903 RepID=A0A3S5A5M1_9PLAT|nr:unnamed protein product [Protopolystoma xenopodis]